jgi:hypothetical protein
MKSYTGATAEVQWRTGITTVDVSHFLATAVYPYRPFWRGEQSASRSSRFPARQMALDIAKRVGWSMKRPKLLQEIEPCRLACSQSRYWLSYPSFHSDTMLNLFEISEVLTASTIFWDAKKLLKGQSHYPHM